MCRGNGGASVFDDSSDYHGFLARLGMVASAYHVEVHAYALMSNHVHLFVRTREANLSRFMQRLISGYTTWHNVRHTTGGHLFQGRYKALLVEKNAYGSEVSRYIHLNCVRTGARAQQTVVQRQAHLRDYPWSSYRAMIGLAPPKEWLRCGDTLRRFGDTRTEQHAAYAAYVEDGLREALHDPADEARAQSILGRERFVDRIRRIIAGRRLGDQDAAQARRELVSATLEQVLTQVARLYGVTPADIVRATRGRRRNDARQVAFWHAWERCAGALSAREIGKALGGVSGCAVVVAHRRIAQRIQGDKRLRRLVARLA